MKWFFKIQMRWRVLLLALGFFLLLTIPFALRLQQARHQQHVVDWVVEQGGFVTYVYELPGDEPFTDIEPTTPVWIRSIFGKDYFESVALVNLEGTDVRTFHPWQTSRICFE